MKQLSAKSPPKSIPRLNSLRHRLEHAPGQDDVPYLDQLMIFLDEPPLNVRGRWKEGAKMCAAWGVLCSHTSVWRLFRTYAIEWRIRLALEASLDDTLKAEVLEEKAAQMLASRTCEIVANPLSSPSTLISMARIELRKKALEFARKKYEDSQRTTVEAALAALEKEACLNFGAQFAIDRLREALKKPKPSPFFKHMLKT